MFDSNQYIFVSQIVLGISALDPYFQTTQAGSPMVADPPRSNSTTRKNPPIWETPPYIAINFKTFIGFLKWILSRFFLLVTFCLKIRSQWGWKQSGFYKDLEYAERGSVANMATCLVLVRMYQVFLSLAGLLLRIALQLCTREIPQSSPASPS